MTAELVNRLAADAVLAAHLVFVLFVVLGLVLILAGGALSWSWVRNPWFRLAHLVAIGVVVLQSWLGVICPLTSWEMALRSRSGDAVYTGSFIAHWLQKVLYYEAPAWVFTVCYSVFALLVVLSWLWIRPRPLVRRGAWRGMNQMTPGSLRIRESKRVDLAAIVALHRVSFGEAEGAQVSQLTADLLEDPTARPLLSLVAEENGAILGHVLFTAVRIDGIDESVACRILAPLGIAPPAQGQGIGGELVRAGLERLREDRVGLVFVLGHPGYYPRFGFEPAGAQGLDAPYPIPEAVSGAWMVQELDPGHLGRVRGTVRCAEVLDRPEHWRE